MTGQWEGTIQLLLLLVKVSAKQKGVFRTTVLLELLVIKWAVKNLGGTYWARTAY